MRKSLPVFGPESKDQNRALAVFGPPEAPAFDSLPLWKPSAEQAPDSISIFSPNHTNDVTSVAVFSVPSGFDPASMPVFCPSVFAEVPPRPPAEFHVTTAAAHAVPKHQGQREIDLIIRKFLGKIKAQNIRYRRVGHTTYTWLHEQEPEPGDTGSDVRWEIKVTGLQINMGVYDIKPFFRVVSTPISVEKLVEVRKTILAEMKTDAGG